MELHVTVSSIRAQEIMKAATERYGPPSKVDHEPFKTRGGGTFPITQMTWNQTAATMLVTLNSGKLGDGSAFLITADEMEFRRKQRASDTQKGARDF
ncbi:hypothetical protein [Ramlibacter sp.]|uniref:hypothetical protein n=1 Tax=Ramlibacter sp. TaxID=1917967 RepID=UPI003D10793E